MRPDNPDVQRSLAGYYRETGNYPAAIAALKSIQSPKPDVRPNLLTPTSSTANQKRPQSSMRRPPMRCRAIWLCSFPRRRPKWRSVRLKLQSLFSSAPLLSIPEHYRLHAIRGEIARLQEHTEEAVHEYNAALAPFTPKPRRRAPVRHSAAHGSDGTVPEPGGRKRCTRHLEIAQTQIGALDDHGPGRPQFLRLRALIKMNSWRPRRRGHRHEGSAGDQCSGCEQSAAGWRSAS